MPSRIDPDKNPDNPWAQSERGQYYNRAHQRRGTLWAERFKSTILEGRQALWNCVKYVELNPVRAGLVDDPAAYRFSTWGAFRSTGRQFFGGNFCRYLRRSLGEQASGWSDEELRREFHSELARTMAAEMLAAGMDVDPHTVKAEARQNESMPLRFLRRTRHWTDGAIIGSKQFVQETECCFEDRSRVMRRQLSRGNTLGGDPLYSLKCLRKV